LWQSRLLSYLFVAPAIFRLKRYPLTLLAVLGAIAIVLALPQMGAWRFACAWAWLSSPFALVPWIPCTVRARIGKPIPPDELFGQTSTPDAQVFRQALARVESEVRDLVRRSRGKRLGRYRPL
jgi:hypothetical protein